MAIHGNFQSVKRALLKMCSNTSFPENRLPSEAELAEKLRVSIVTLRKALTVLETEGYILKRQGIGNFVLSSALDPTMRIDLTYDMMSLLETSGFSDVRKESCPIYETPGPDSLRDCLKLSKEQQMLALDYHYWAEDQVVIVERFYLPKNAVKQRYQETEYQHIDSFIWNCCRLELQHSINTWHPLLPTETLQKILHLPADQPLISWEQIIYDIHDIPVCGAEVFFHPDKIHMRSLFKWNFSPDSTIDL